jgi:hypothetical protein
MELDEAIAILLELLRDGRAAFYGYDLFPFQAAREAVARMQRERPRDQAIQAPRDQQAVIELSPVFFEAAWELCRRGFVRPGVRRAQDQAVTEGGYSLTIAGRAALAALDPTTILLAQPGSLAAALAGYGARFGEGFHQRALEAIKCRNAEAWLACCAMAGAAAESVLLALAITRTGNEDQVMRDYTQAGGRQRVLNHVVGQANAARRNTLTTFSAIISMWRDEAGHGQATPLSTANADEALRQLLQMCQWVDREWAALTA